MSSSTGEMFSPETKVATPETPSASAEYKDAMNAKRRRFIEPVNVPCLEPVNVPEPIQECKHDATTAYLFAIKVITTSIVELYASLRLAAT